MGEDTQETNYADDPMWNLVGGTITSFGGNQAGELFMSVKKGEKVTEFIIGYENGEVTLYEAQIAPEAPGSDA
jgi:hypothetical protein